MKRTVVVVVLLAAGFCLGQAAAPLPFPWAGAALNKTRTMTELEWRCEKLAVGRERRLLSGAIADELRLTPHENGLRVQAVLSPSRNLPARQESRAIYSAVDALLAKINKDGIKIPELGKGGPLEKIKFAHLRVEAAMGGNTLVLGLTPRELGPQPERLPVPAHRR